MVWELMVSSVDREAGGEVDFSFARGSSEKVEGKNSAGCHCLPLLSVIMRQEKSGGSSGTNRGRGFLKGWGEKASMLCGENKGHLRFEEGQERKRESYSGGPGAEGGGRSKQYRYF